MRKIIIVLFLVGVALLNANLVRNQPTEINQPDGTKLSLFITGDEFYRRVHDANGYTVVLDPDTGYAVYAVPDGDGIRPSKIRVGSSDPADLGIRPGLMRDRNITRSIIQNHRLASGTPDDRAPSTGTVNNIFVFCRFNDQSEYTTALSFYDNMCNSTTAASMRGYFLEESNSQLTINTTFYPAAVGGIVRSYQDSHDRDYFLPYHATDNPDGYPPGPPGDPDYYGYQRLQTMLRAAIVSISGSVPEGLNIDGDGDGKVDNVSFVCQGSTGSWGDPLWPHWWTLHMPSAVYIRGKRVWDYNMQLSNGIYRGVICHEMSHSMGFPDLYHYDDDYDHLNPVGSWDLMESDQNIPQHHLTHMKRKYGGWFATVPTITPSVTPVEYTLTAIDQSPFSCYKINSTLPNEYYMIEYRRKTGTYENSLPGSGLIIYRIISSFDGDDLDGNAWGPPDEVYIYRPNGTITVNGSIGSAHYSSTAGRTAIHNFTNPKPWLYSDTHTSIDGNLVITDIGASGGTTITFKVRLDPPNVWTGATSTAWTTGSNWSRNSVPTSTQDVEIPGSLARYPVVSTTTPECKNLLIKAGASVTIGNGTLNVMQDVDCYGTITINNDAGNLYVGDDIVFQSGSTATFSAAGEYWIGGDLDLNSGCNVNLTQGYIDFSGTSPSYIRCYQASALNHLRSHKTSSFLSISNLSNSTLTLNGNYWIYDGSTSYCSYGGNVIMKGSMLCYSGGMVSFNSGTLRFEGTASSSIYFEDSGSYLNNLSINKAGNTVFLSSNAEVRGNVTIGTGVLNPGAYTLTVAGNWTNSVGTSGFAEATSTVIFTGTGSQNLGSETFYKLELNKTGGMLTIPTGATVACSIYDWTAGSYTVSGGTFTVADLADPGIFGTIVLSSGTINYTQDTGQYIDLRANLNISNGTFNVYGGHSNCYFSYVDSATLTMSGGVLDIKDVGIYLHPSYVFNDNITGGTIKTSRSFLNNRADFNPSGGTVTLYGSADASLINTAGSNLFHLTIDKSSTRDISQLSSAEYAYDREGNRNLVTRVNQVSCSGPLDVNGNFTIQAGTFIAPPEMWVAGNWVNNVGPTGFTEGIGTVTFDSSGHQYCNQTETFNTLNINKSGGAVRVNNSAATVTCNTYTWVAGAVDVLLGTFTAYDLSQNGIYGNFYVNPGATINLHQGSDQWIDLNGQFYLTGGGTINVYGGSLDCYFAFDAPGGITMSGGNIWFRDRGLYFTNRPHLLTLNISGGFIRAKGSFTDLRGGVVFPAGTVELFGPGAHVITMGAGSAFNNLTTNKTSTRDDINPNPAKTGRGVEVIESHGRIQTDDYRDDSITANTDIVINGTLTISAGIFNVNSASIYVVNDLAIWGTLRMITSGSWVDVDDDVIWQSTSTSHVSHGNINCAGNWTFAMGSIVDLTGSVTLLNNPYGGSLTNNSTNAGFGNLIIGGTEEEPEFTFYYASPSSYLAVLNNLTILDGNTLNLNGGNTSVYGYTMIYPAAAIVNGAGTFTIYNYLDLRGNLSTGSGTVDVNGTFINNSSAYLSIDGGTFRNDAPWQEPNVVSLECGLYINNGTLQITNKSLSIQAHASRIYNNPSIVVGMGFIVTADNTFRPATGVLTMIGTGNPVLQVSGNNWIPSLSIQKSALANTVYLQNNTIIKGDVQLLSGKLNTSNYSLSVSGNWTNTAGVSDFTAGSGTVTFNKTGGDQTVTGPINFYHVTDAHTGNALTFNGPTGISGNMVCSNIVYFQNVATIGTLNNSATAAITAFNSAHTSNVANYLGGGSLRALSGSHVIIADLFHNGLVGSFTANSAHLEIHQDNGSWIDLNGPVTIQNNGIMDIYGGSSSCYIAYAGNVSFIMSSGSFNVKNQGIVVHSGSYTCTFNITGGTISTSRSFTDNRGNFNPTAGTVLFEGSADSSVSLTSPSAFRNVVINKVAARESVEPMFETGHNGEIILITRAANLSFGPVTINGNLDILAANHVYLNGTLNCLNAGFITVDMATLNLNGNQLNSTGNITVYGTLNLSAGSVLKVANNKSLTIYNGGRIHMIGTSGNPATVTRNGNGNYVFDVEVGGTIAAAYAVFEYISINGVNVKSGAIVDINYPFDNCVFRNGPSASRLLTINNSQTLTINYASFPVLGIVGSYNVSKTQNEGRVTFTNYSGDFSGATYEQDTHNRIDWAPFGVPPITDLQIERQAPNNIRIWWTYAHPFTQFIIYAADSPDGSFIQVGSTTNMYWAGPSADTIKFYQVRVSYP
ncbi:MAG: hypothetical protein FJ042_01880 [Candidatus Cloacimonetes bacterium]|nr:hypothetical protein [Candidatus Cloacimonadota bacterium]